MGETIAWLEQQGYVERLPDPSDGRATLVRRTELGWRVNRIAREQVEATQAEWMRALGEADFAQLMALLRHLVRLLDYPAGVAGDARTLRRAARSSGTGRGRGGARANPRPRRHNHDCTDCNVPHFAARRQRGGSSQCAGPVYARATRPGRLRGRLLARRCGRDLDLVHGLGEGSVAAARWRARQCHSPTPRPSPHQNPTPAPPPPPSRPAAS